MEAKEPKTLKSRTASIVYLAFFTSAFFFTIIILSFGLILFKSQLKTECQILSKSLATDINNKKIYMPQNSNIVMQKAEKNTKNKPTIKPFIKNKSSKNMPHTPIEDGKRNIDRNSLIKSRIYLSKERETLYKEISSEKASYDKSPLKLLYNYFNISNSEPIKNSSGKVVAYALVRVNSALMVAVINVIILVLLLTSILLLIVGRIMSKLFAIPIITPINILETKMSELASENYDSNSYTPLSIKRPFKEIESMLQSTNLIMKKMNLYTDQLSEQKKDIENQFYELEAQNQELIESRAQIQLAKESLDVSEKAVKNILNNVGQGFLTFDEDLIVNDEYSLECEKIFGGSIKDRKFHELIYPNDSQQANFINELSIKILKECDVDKRNLYMPLLPNEVSLDGKTLHTEYKIIEDSRNKDHLSLMVMLTDISERKNLQNQIEKERNILKMVVKTVVNYNDFIESVKEYRNFYNFKLNDILSSNKNVDEILFEIFRNIHTFKGTFMQLYMVNIVPHLHEMESTLSALTKQTSSLTIDNISRYISSCQMDSWLEDDIRLLKNTLGTNFFNQKDKIVIDKEKLTNIEKKMMDRLSPSDYNLLVSELNILRYKPFNEMIKPYAEYSQNIANRMGKLLNPITIKGGDFLADNKRYSSLMHNIVHIFRNMVDHGIELPEERLVNNKDEYGNIYCNIELKDNNIILRIGDDGKGIDVQTVKEKLINKGIYSEETLEKFTNHEILNLIFLDGFSTKDHVTEFSGRGVGLSAIKNVINKLGGRIAVNSKVNCGTEFCITVPFISSVPTRDISIQDFMKSSIKVAKQFLTENIKLNSTVQLYDYKFSSVENIPLKSHTAFITLRGIFDGTFILSIDKEIANRIEDNLVIEKLTQEEKNSLVEDSIAEFSNIILGNSLKDLPELEEFLKVDPPVTISCKSASIKYSSSKIWSCNILYDVGSLSLSFVCSSDKV